MEYVAPQLETRAFTCPHCGVLARQYPFSAAPSFNSTAEQHGYSEHPICTTICENCGKVCIWHKDMMIYPNRGSAPQPNPDMPEEVNKDYEEAASISIQSPRGAAALLRLAIQKLVVYLGGKGKNINEDIALLVRNGLPEKVQQALDVVRVVGNNAVHPGQIETDDPEVVGNLFSLANVITEYMISMPNKISGLYKELPESAKKAVASRDKKTAS